MQWDTRIRERSKPLPHLFIDTMVSTDLADIQRIADCRLGPAYLSPAKILHKEWEAFSAYKGSRVVGFLCASLLPLAVFQQHYPSLSSVLERQGLLMDPIGIIHVVAVDQAYEKQGIGTALITHGFDAFFLIQNGPLTVVTAAWADHQGAHIGGPLTHNQFRNIGDLPDYWRADSLARGYECPTCGKPPCRCTASIFIRTLPA